MPASDGCRGRMWQSRSLSRRRSPSSNTTKAACPLVGIMPICVWPEPLATPGLASCERRSWWCRRSWHAGKGTFSSTRGIRISATSSPAHRNQWSGMLVCSPHADLLHRAWRGRAHVGRRSTTPFGTGCKRYGRRSISRRGADNPLLRLHFLSCALKQTDAISRCRCFGSQPVRHGADSAGTLSKPWVSCHGALVLCHAPADEFQHPASRPDPLPGAGDRHRRAAGAARGAWRRAGRCSAGALAGTAGGWHAGRGSAAGAPSAPGQRAVPGPRGLDAADPAPGPRGGAGRGGRRAGHPGRRRQGARRRGAALHRRQPQGGLRCAQHPRGRRRTRGAVRAGTAAGHRPAPAWPGRAEPGATQRPRGRPHRPGGARWRGGERQQPQRPGRQHRRAHGADRTDRRLAHQPGHLGAGARCLRRPAAGADHRQGPGRAHGHLAGEGRQAACTAAARARHCRAGNAAGRPRRRTRPLRRNRAGPAGRPPAAQPDAAGGSRLGQEPAAARVPAPALGPGLPLVAAARTRPAFGLAAAVRPVARPAAAPAGDRRQRQRRRRPRQVRAGPGALAGAAQRPGARTAGAADRPGLCKVAARRAAGHRRPAAARPRAHRAAAVARAAGRQRRLARGAAAGRPALGRRRVAGRLGPAAEGRARPGAGAAGRAARAAGTPGRLGRCPAAP